MKNLKNLHSPVLKREVLVYLRVSELAHLKDKAKFIDATLGLGGHTEEFVKSGVRVLGIEADPNSLELSKIRLRSACPGANESVHAPSYTLKLGNFKDIDEIAQAAGFSGAVGVLIDLGISSFQLDDTSRGFSFNELSSPLDMRIDRVNQGVTAANLLSSLNKGALGELFSVVIKRRGLVSRLTDAVLTYRSQKKLATIGDFLEILRMAGLYEHKKTLALPFLALRIAVNSEVENLVLALPKAFGVLAPGGRLAVISFHSGEDTLVKDFFKELEIKGLARFITKKPVVPSAGEIVANSRARSAKMRVLEKI